jgi:RHS repeat-associated protein
MNDNGTMKYLLTDHLGSTIAVADSAGTLLEQTRYLPFGSVRDDSGTVTSTDKTFTGQRSLPATGLMDYNARMYDPGLGRFVQPDTIIPNPYDPVDLNRYSYARNNPVKYDDPSGHCPLCIIAVLVIGAIVLTGDTPQTAPQPVPADGNASNVWELMKLGIEHAAHANITGEGLKSLQNDPSVQAEERNIEEEIRSDPLYGKQAFAPKDYHMSFTAGSVDGSWVKGALTGNPSFWMVHTGTLYATNTKVYKNGTISTTWKVEDSFDYIPDWAHRDLRPNLPNYLAYNIFAQIVSPIYHGLLQAKPFTTNAYWQQTIPTLKKSISN